MPYYRGRRWRRRPRRYVRRWFRRRFRRYVNGSSRSISRIKTSFVETHEISAGYGTTPGDVVYTLPYGSLNNAKGSLAHSLLYRQYCNLYEEVKIIGVKVALSVVTPVGDQVTPSLQIYTAWDRKHGRDEAAPTGQKIMASSTYNVATALNNNVAKITRACYASDLMERAVWIDSNLTADTFTGKAWYQAGVNPTMFCPSFMFTTLSPSLGAAHNITVSLSYTYYLAFRNPKFGGGEQSARVEDMGVRAVSFADDDGDGDMDDGGDVDEPNQPQIDAALAAAAVGGSTVKTRPKSAALMEASHRKKHAANKAIVLDPPSKNV